MKLTVNQAIEELKRLQQDNEKENFSAIEKRYGSVKQSWRASAKMRDFILGCGYCSHCYEKQKSIDDLESGMCIACYDWAENQYLYGGI